MKRGFIRLFSVFVAALLAVSGLVSCAPKEFNIPDGTVMFELYAADPIVSHEVGQAGENRTWACGVEDFTSTKAFLENAGKLAAVDGINLKKGSYILQAEISVFAQPGKAGNQNTIEPVAALQVSRGGSVIANEYIIGTVSMVSDDFTFYFINFDAAQAGKYDFSIINTGRCAVAAARIILTADKNKDTGERVPVAAAFTEAESQKNLQYEDGKLYFYDLRKTLDLHRHNFQNQFDIAAVTTALQGLVNRDKPRLYVRQETGGYQSCYPEVDMFWLDYLSTEKKWLPSRENIIEIEGISTLLRMFESYFAGLAVWDNLVPATSNVALTDAGVNNTIPVRFSQNRDSVYGVLYGKYPVKLDLQDKFTGKGNIWGTKIKSTGSTKNDAYIWATEQYIKGNKTNPYVMACYIDAWVGPDGYMPINFRLPSGGRLTNGTNGEADNNTWATRIFDTTIVNRDYYIAEKAFFVDLSVTDLHNPIDDKGQTEGLDLATLEMLLGENNKRAPDRPVEMGGFVKWQLKYSQSVDAESIQAGGVEGIASKIYTKYNVTWSPDAGSSYANASIFRMYPQKPQYVNKNKERMYNAAQSATLENKNYVLIYMGDYDSAAWMHRYWPTMFQDPRLGDYPLSWPVTFVNAKRAAHAIDYVYEHASDNDVFVGGNNGYGYCYWTNFFIERGNMNGSLDEYAALTKKYNKQFDIDVLGVYFSGENFAVVPAATRNKIYDTMADLYPRGVTVYLGSHAYEHNGVTFTGKDPGKNYTDITYQGGVLTVLTDDTDGYGYSQNMISQGRRMNVAHPVPRFHAMRIVISTPSDMFGKIEAMMRKYPEYNFEIVDPYKFFKLYNEYRRNCDAGVYIDL